MTVEETERTKYERVWQEDAYRQVCHSKVLWDEHRDCFPDTFHSALDIGCGLGLMIAEWNAQGINTHGIDIAENCLFADVEESYRHKFRVYEIWNLKWEEWPDRWWDKRFDVGVCADVMEHIPIEFVDESLRRIAKYCRHVVFKIDHATNSFIGETLHLTIEPVEWWIAQMNAITGNAEFVRTAKRGGGIEGSIVVWRTDT